MTPEQALRSAEHNDAATLARWLDAGGDPDAIFGERSLLYAASTSAEGTDALALLLSRGADPELGAQGYIWSPLTGAASACSKGAVELLLRAGADPRPAIGLVCEGEGRGEILSLLQAAAGEP